MLEERSVLLVKEETEYGTDPTPSPTTNAILAIGAKIKEVVEPAERSVQTKSLSRNASLLGSIYCELTFQVELRGSGTRGTAARLGDLLEACGMYEGAVAGSSVSYKPTSSSIKSVTVYLYKDGRKYVVTGARGKPKLLTPAGKIATLEFTMLGLYTAPTDAVLPATVTYESTVPPVCKGVTLSLDSVTTLKVQSSELDVGNEVGPRVSKIAATGVGSVEITSRKPMLTINPESVPIATIDLRTKLLTTPVAYSEVIGSTSGNIITITVPKANYSDIEYADREGIMVENIKCECTRNSDAGDDEFEICFT